jgi:hypothetical protein
MLPDPMLRDLTRHMHDRIGKVIDDYFERLSWTGRKYDRDQLAEALGSTILGIAAIAMKAKTQSTLDEFITQARKAYSKD